MSRYSLSGLTFLFTILAAATALQAQPKTTFQSDQLIVENDRIRRVYTIQEANGTPSIYPSSFYSKTAGQEMLSNSEKAWFRFGINGTVVSSKKGHWSYEGYDTQTLSNDGLEVSITMVSQKGSGVGNDVQLTYVVQIFPGSSITRERMVIQPDDGSSVAMTTQENQVVTEFPIYTLHTSGTNNVRAEEIRLASWAHGMHIPDDKMRLSPYDTTGRFHGWGAWETRSLAGNHMYDLTRRRNLRPARSDLSVKGPILALQDLVDETGFVMMYEHGSPDHRSKLDLIHLTAQAIPPRTTRLSVNPLRGAYLNGEEITEKNPYRTLWVDVGPSDRHQFSAIEEDIWQFVYEDLARDTRSREPTIYYNTWGMQLDYRNEGGDVHSALTMERLLEEAQIAHRLGVDVFTVDDGWMNPETAGNWHFSEKRFPDHLARLKKQLDKYNMDLGLWMITQAASTESDVFQQHREWVERSKDGELIRGQQDFPKMCMRTGFYEHILGVMKRLVDEGARYFKWDGVMDDFCYSPNHGHGTEEHTPAARAARYAYAKPLLMARLARDIKAYHPEVKVVYDVTEMNRGSIGLAFLREARFFWSNNAGSETNDFSSFRSKSMRNIPATYNQVIPTILQPSALYPHDARPYGAQRYNLATMFLGMNGMWGDLSEMDEQEIETAAQLIADYKRVASTVVATHPINTGSIGSSPEFYEMIDADRAEGQVIGFSGSELVTSYRTKPINTRQFLGVLRNAYTLDDDNRLRFDFFFREPDDTRHAFILGRSEFPGYIAESTAWLADVEVIDGQALRIVNGAAGRHVILLTDTSTQPDITFSDPDQASAVVEQTHRGIRITVQTQASQLTTTVRP